MTLCVFVLIASEFLPVSLLTPIAGELNITEGLAGQGIAISGALAVLTSLTISNLAGSLNRKHLLLGLTVLMAVSGMIVALAHSYAIYMAGRALIGIVIGDSGRCRRPPPSGWYPRTRFPARWRFSTAATRWRPSWPRRLAAIWGHRRLARRLFLPRAAGDSRVHLAMLQPACDGKR
jgi:MFS family permease